MKIKEFLNKDNWTKGAYARNINGESVNPNDADACKFCVVGAITKVYGTRLMVQQVVTILATFVGSVINFNDGSCWEQVEELLQKADV